VTVDKTDEMVAKGERIYQAEKRKVERLINRADSNNVV
jgi:hypothetical protein